MHGRVIHNARTTHRRHVAGRRGAPFRRRGDDAALEIPVVRVHGLPEKGTHLLAQFARAREPNHASSLALLLLLFALRFCDDGSTAQQIAAAAVVDAIAVRARVAVGAAGGGGAGPAERQVWVVVVAGRFCDGGEARFHGSVEGRRVLDVLLDELVAEVVDVDLAVGLLAVVVEFLELVVGDVPRRDDLKGLAETRFGHDGHSVRCADELSSQRLSAGAQVNLGRASAVRRGEHCCWRQNGRRGTLLLLLMWLMMKFIGLKCGRKFFDVDFIAIIHSRRGLSLLIMMLEIMMRISRSNRSNSCSLRSTR